ncbi:MAG: peroxiredoxin [Caldicoprobacter oshimai]|uniref:Peroxiredoxin n=1 Tax=Caldicoprobacter faecalis TaxID=937334 RepID=A0A1I5VNX5_9FIRM|nr:peroxiredoxin [Caldicoprobacter faecalis]PZN10717.1 MAG: peroxiredoxin [Caldicoprobacter oshimai]SFQ09132.1 1-Cys peroxiredoxin [Caldicoprobacter faecalis]
MEEIRMKLLGEKFPSMEVITTHGTKKLPEDYAGEWFVLFSHPADFTPVCTTEFVEFARKAPEFKELNTELIGLSVDQIFSHIKWVEWMKENTGITIPFPVIADELGRVANQLGMIHPGKGTNTVRAVFIVDDKGIIRLIMYYPQEVGRNVDEILRALKALQISDKYDVALPEKWPNNYLIKDHVIVPPSKDEAGANERKEKIKAKEIEAFDWWFVHKPLK